MRGWQPSIAMTRVVPERSAPIMMTGRSLELTGIFCSFEVAEPIEKIDEHFRGRVLKTGEAYLLQDRFPAFAGIEGDERGTHLGDLLVRDLRRRDHGHVG